MHDNPPFEVGDIIRERYSSNHYLIIEEILSDRTKNVTHYTAKDLSSGHIKNISWIYFDNYVIEA
jgi:hypothetical protein